MNVAQKNNAKVVAGIVLYNPNVKRLIKNIDMIAPQVEKLILFDNHSENLNAIKEIIRSSRKIILIKSEENKGIAYALNKIALYAVKHKYSWLLTLDQDSVVKKDLIKKYCNYISLSNVGQLCCNYIDKKALSNVKNTKDSFNVKKVNFCITSGSLLNLDAFVKIGGFNSALFIDDVDIDICYRLRLNGYSIYKIDYVGFEHELGDLKEYYFLGKKISVYNHSPIRHYYMMRNDIILAKDYPKLHSLKSVVLRQSKELFKVIFFEKDTFKKIKYSIRGIRDGVNRKRK